jgi:hypothetical protein
MEKIARVVDETHAQLWINQDEPSSDARYAPELYELAASRPEFHRGRLRRKLINAGGEDLLWRYGVSVTHVPSPD